MNEKLEEISKPIAQPVLRRQRALTKEHDMKRFWDKKSSEILFGNPDPEHLYNKRSLVRISQVHSFLFFRQDINEALTPSTAVRCKL